MASGCFQVKAAGSRENRELVDRVVQSHCLSPR